MSFFKDLKDDIAQSVNELAETLDDGFAEESGEAAVSAQDTGYSTEDIQVTENDAVWEEEIPEIIREEALPEEKVTDAEEIEETENTVDPADTTMEEESDMDTMETMNAESVMPEMPETPVMPEMPEAPVMPEDNAEEVTVITKGTTINGGIKSDTSLVVKGTIEGDVECQGKLTITGRVAGNTIASEIYVNTPRLEGDINSKGIVKIDVGTVVIGNVNCTSVLVSGAVKGNIEVNGPVIVDSTAVVKGDIKAKSIQINSGAVIDGHCSLQYADVDLDAFFE